MSFYQNGILISGVNTLPELTRAQYEALPADKRPEYWVCLDEEYEPVTSGGHTIEDTDGTEMSQEPAMQFVGVYTEDDSTNDRTKVNIVREMTSAQMDALTPAQKKGFIRTTDEPDNPLNIREYVEVVADGEISFSQAFDSLRSAIDVNKIQPASLITLGTVINYRAFTLCTTGSSELRFINNDILDGKVTLTVILIRVSNSAYIAMNNDGEYNDYSSNRLDSGTVIRLYY